MFFIERSKYYDGSYPINIEADTLAYVRKGDIFKYKDCVEASVLINCLAEFCYMEFV